MMNKKEVQLASSTLADFLEAGISISQSVDRLRMVLPKYSSVWVNAKNNIEKGYPFSSSLHGVWEESLVAVLKAGEDSGKVANIFRDIEHSIDIELKVSGEIRRLYYPLSMIVGGLFVGLFFMLTVIPGIAGASRSNESAVLQMSVELAEFMSVYYPYVIFGGITLVAGLVLLFKSPVTKRVVLDMLLSVPIFRKAITELQFGIWARYISLALSAGIGTKSALEMTEVILKGKMREVVRLIRRDLENNIPLEASVNKDRLSVNDPRQLYLPFFIANAFTTGASISELSGPLAKASPSLIKQGTKSVTRIVQVSVMISMSVAAFSILSPLAIVYSEMFNSMSNL
jgi:type II secretory pathway component PulF